MKFKPTAWGNELLESDGFYISYNSDPGMGFSFLQGDNKSDETALVKEDDTDNQFRILNGDFREEFEAIIECGFEECLALYNKLSGDHDSSWSIHQTSAI